MNKVPELIKNLQFDEPESPEDLKHYGVRHRSGRYPWGSGKNPYQHSGDFLSRVEQLHKKGLSEKQIVDAINNELPADQEITTTQLRAYKAIAKSERRSLEVARAKSLRADGKSLNEIAQIMGYKNDSSVRSLLNESSEKRMNAAQATANLLKQQIKEKGMLDVGEGVERELGISREKFGQALAILEADGYPVYTRGVAQVTNPGRQTITMVLCPKDTEYKEVYDSSKIHTVKDYISYDGGDTFKKAFEYPESMDSKRMKIRYAEDGGIRKDGVVELRPGVEDLSLGNSAYAQVRILVDGTHYIKGMAVYGDPKDFPAGVDVIFNTNKHKNVDKMDVLKKIKPDPDNPFGALVKERGGQRYYDDPEGRFIDEATGKRQSLSLINKTREEGDWGEWSKELPSQFLSKQSLQLIKKQLSLSEMDKQSEFEEIRSLTNPTLKKVMLETFANDCDSAAVHLKAASLPRQKYQVILPLTDIKDTEVFAPQFHDGETVALIRFPHGGTFEIPILKVNNKNKEGRKVITSTAADAVGISSSVAERLSGADFDGDTVLVIPCNSEHSKIKINSTPPLKGLEGFDSKSYKYDEIKKDSNGVEHYYRNGIEFKPMKNPKTGGDSTQMQMGIVSNLITDMTLKGATDSELARAVRHSMVVIDAAKHGLDYKQSEKENGIAELKRKYQGHYNDDGEYHEGANTLISRASSKQEVLKRQGSPKINQKGKDWYDPSKPEGSLIYKEVVETYTDKKGKTKTRMQDSTRMAETTDARTLSSGTPQEELYASYANRMKNLANQARMEQVHTGRIQYSSDAKQKYSSEREHLLAQLAIAQANAPRERAAQIMANATMEAKRQDNPDMTTKEKKKAAQQALTAARQAVGAQRHAIEISDREWEAIQAGAISENQLYSILKATDIDKLRERATPRESTSLSTAKMNKIQAMKNSGYTIDEIAKAVGVSTSTVNKYLKN
ncbi:MAG: helix-turn-helix domain-containing protein [Clostridiales bacterium]|nr:helix-turn-helix domain-containing protein [Clostridiales bacterium]